MPIHSTRNHAFDHLKTTMMIAVVIAHAALTYIVTEVGELWPFKDLKSASLIFDVVVAYIASNSMPAFFVMSGFLTRAIFERQGLRSMVMNRLNRVFYPLLAGLLVIFPIVIVEDLYFRFFIAGEPFPLRMALSEAYRQQFGFQSVKLIHLWFLYCLILLCIGCGSASVLIKKARPLVRDEIRHWFLLAYRSRAAPLLFSVPTFLLLCLRNRNIIETPTSFSINIIVLMSYGMFFGFGWILFHWRAHLSRFAQGDVLFFIAGVCLFLAKLGIRDRWGESGAIQYVLAACTSVFIWLLVFAYIGLYLKHFNAYSRVGRYLSDASYWIYIIHLPLVLLMQAVLLHSTLNVFVKFLVVLVFTFAIAIISYNYWVRDTFIGVFLSGKRYRKGLPKD